MVLTDDGDRVETDNWLQPNTIGLCCGCGGVLYAGQSEWCSLTDDKEYILDESFDGQLLKETLRISRIRIARFNETRTPMSLRARQLGELLQEIFS